MITSLHRQKWLAISRVWPQLIWFDHKHAKLTASQDVFPASLRVLALYNLEQYFTGTLEHLVKDCTALEELYLCHFNTESNKPPRFQKMWPAMANLRVLVLDCCNFSCDYCEWVSQQSWSLKGHPKIVFHLYIIRIC